MFSGAAKILLLTMFLVSGESVLQAQDQVTRPKVGLALSGGGAKGIAHIGVLKVMEEAGLRPDFISGVSMGSIVGGLYAIGYSADDLKEIVKSIDWNLLLSDNIPENKVIFLEKHYFNNSILKLPVTRYRISLPSGLINGQQIESALSNLIWPAANINDFSKLPIPFMCVGTDISTCKKVDITGGYLADAMRASMAVPSVFTPFTIDTIMYVDGGMVRNFAVTELKQMGADIVIGSYTGGRLVEEEKLNSLSGVMEQIAFYAGYYDSQDQMNHLDILIKPKLNDITMFAFNYADTIIGRGYRAALPFKDYFRKLADSLNRTEPQKEIENILGRKYYSFDKIESAGNSIISDDQILGVLGIEPGEDVDKLLLSERIELLYGKGWFEKVKYRIKQQNDSLFLLIDCQEKPRVMLTGSLHYDNYTKAGIILGFSGENLLTQRSKIHIDSYIGDYFRLRFKYLQFIDRNQKYGISADIYAEKNLLPGVYISGNLNEGKFYNSFYNLTLHGRVGLNQMFSISGGIDRTDLRPNMLIIPSIKRLSADFLTYSFDYSINTLDTKHFPNRGSYSFLTAGTSLPLSIILNNGTVKTKFTTRDPGEYSFERFYTLRVGLKQYYSPGKKWTFSLAANGLLITDTLSNQNNFYFLGGTEPTGIRSVAMSGYNSHEVASKKFAGAGADADFEVIRNVHLNFGANAFFVQEASAGDSFSLFTGYNLGAGYLSIVGPIKAGIMYSNYRYQSNSSKIKGYVSLGYNF